MSRECEEKCFSREQHGLTFLMLTNRKQAFLSSFFQCLKGLVMLAEYRRMEKRKMEEKKIYCLKKGGGKQHDWREQCSGDDTALGSSDLIPL